MTLTLKDFRFIVHKGEREVLSIELDETWKVYDIIAGAVSWIRSFNGRIFRVFSLRDETVKIKRPGESHTFLVTSSQEKDEWMDAIQGKCLKHETVPENQKELLDAVKVGDTNKMEALLAQGADINAVFGSTMFGLLHHAVQAKRLDVLEFLLKKVMSRWRLIAW